MCKSPAACTAQQSDDICEKMKISLEPMSEEELQDYCKHTIPNYARELQRAQDLNELDALEHAQKSYDSLLPNGIESKDQFLFNIIGKTPDELGEKKLGILWFAKKTQGSKDWAFIYDIEVKSEFRGQGIGKKAMTLLEDKVKAMGLSSIGLHAFGNNLVAIGLYEKLGYQTVDIVMRKVLE